MIEAALKFNYSVQSLLLKIGDSIWFEPGKHPYSSICKGQFHFKLAGKLKAREVADEIMNYALQQYVDAGKSKITGKQTINDAANTFRVSFG